MKRLSAIIFLNFKQAVRDKFFNGVVFFFFFYAAFCMLLGKLSPGHEDKVLMNAALTGIEISALLLLLFSFVSSFFREKNSKILQVYLSDFKRPAYLSGKIIGYFSICIFYLMLCSISAGIILYLNKALMSSFFIAIYFIALKLFIFLLFCSIFSCIFSTATLALLSSLFLFLASELMPAALDIVMSYGNAFQRILVRSLYHILPNMDKLDIKLLAAHGNLPSFDFLLTVSVYAIVYMFMLWCINILIFSKKEY